VACRSTTRAITPAVLDLFSPYTVLGGLAVLSMFVTHGAIFIALKTTGHSARRS
jgi:cytochrome d ubiquinol oxidase subunit II